MNKLLVFLMSVALIMALAACGSKSPAATTAATATSSSTAAPAAGEQKITLQATNFKYDQKEYRVKKGQPVTITLDNKEGMHGAAIKDFNVKLDNSNKTMTFTPDKTGTFTINCSVMCGTGHADMKSTLIVE
jgi:cytochrome c oxidase subunit 2